MCHAASIEKRNLLFIARLPFPKFHHDYTGIIYIQYICGSRQCPIASRKKSHIESFTRRRRRSFLLVQIVVRYNFYLLSMEKWRRRQSALSRCDNNVKLTTWRSAALFVCLHAICTYFFFFFLLNICFGY